MDEIVGQLNYRGDIRGGMQPGVTYSPRYGAMIPVAVEYDEERDLTTASFASLRLEG